MSARSWILDFPNRAALVLNRFEKLGFDAVDFAEHLGIDRTNPNKWAPGRKRKPGEPAPATERSPMPVETLEEMARYAMLAAPEKGREIAEALVGHVLTVCGVRVASTAAAAGEGDVDTAASRMVRAFLDLARLHAELTAPSSDGGVRLTPDEARQLAPHLPAVIALVEEALAAMPEDNQVVLPWARRTA